MNCSSLSFVIMRLDMPTTPFATRRPPPIAAADGRKRFHPVLWLTFAIIVLVATACAAAAAPSSPVDANPAATEVPTQPLPTLRPLPTATPPPQTCDPVRRAQLTEFEGVLLPVAPHLLDGQREIILPTAWAIAAGSAVAGTSAGYRCATPGLHVDFAIDIGAPKDHTRVNALGSLGDQPFEILVDTANVEFFASTLLLWTDEITSGFGPDATKLSPQLIAREASNLYRFPPLPELIPGADYLFTVRLDFIGDNEITYLWRIPG